jgi:SAM-dependent MidA family methyltransferase
MDVLTLLQREQERCGGAIPLREWMRLALFDPLHGYYTTQIRDVGRGGDFSTAPSKTSLPARAVRAWLGKVYREHPALSGVPLTEIGAGAGNFAREFRRRFPIPRPLQIIEISPRLREMQRRRAGGFRLRWFDSPRSVLEASSGRAVFFANELIDAFPCSVFQKCENGWREVGLRIEGDKVHEVLLPPQNLPPSGLLAPETFGSHPPGARVETHETFRSWLAEWVPEAVAVDCLLMDYPRASRMPLSGTLRGYWRQQRITGREIYARFGKQDLTADVYFPDILRWAEELGAEILAHTTLAAFLKEHLPVRARSEAEAARFLDAGDAGGAFEVIHMRIKK